MTGGRWYAERSRRYARWKWHASVGAFLLISACGPEIIEVPVASIEGRWTTTDDPRYADRAFEVTEDFLYLLQGGDTFAVHTIRDIEVVDDDLPEYTIEYRGDEGDLFSFRVYLSQAEGGTLFLVEPDEYEVAQRPRCRRPVGPTHGSVPRRGSPGRVVGV